MPRGATLRSHSAAASETVETTLNLGYSRRSTRSIKKASNKRRKRVPKERASRAARNHSSEYASDAIRTHGRDEQRARHSTRVNMSKTTASYWETSSDSRHRFTAGLR